MQDNNYKRFEANPVDPELQRLLDEEAAIEAADKARRDGADKYLVTDMSSVLYLGRDRDEAYAKFFIGRCSYVSGLKSNVRIYTLIEQEVRT